MIILDAAAQKHKKDMERLTGVRSICLDTYGMDADGKKYDLGIQREDTDADLHRSRYQPSVLDIETWMPRPRVQQIAGDIYHLYHKNGSLFEALVPYLILSKNLSITCSAVYYQIVHGTTPDSMVFSHFF